MSGDHPSLFDQLPPEFLERIRRQLGGEYRAFVDSYLQEPPVGLRVNPRKISPEQFERLARFDLEPLPGIPGGFLVMDEAQPGKHPYHAAGLYYLQDPSAMLAAQLLDPHPGEMVLDVSAAPGGKSTQLISEMQDQSLLIANEIDPHRVWDLVENLERWGAKNVSITNETPARMAKRLPQFFDRIMVDAPCSGEGMFRKSEAARQQWSPALVESCALRQVSILEEAAGMLKPGGRLAYVTCTFAPEEDEQVVAGFLESHPDFQLIEPPLWTRLATSFSDRQVGAFPQPVASHTLRLWPHRWPGGGQFIALLEKTGVHQPARVPAFRVGKLPAKAGRSFDRFREEILVDFYPDGPLWLEGDLLYQLPASLPNLRGLKVTRPGWLLGEIKKDRFEPSHALALGLKKEQSQRCLDLPANDVRVLAYLHGEVLHSDGPDGWLLVCVDGFPLGWGKRVHGVIKNHYPRGLRWV